jgi:hypothetical protein
MLDSSCVEQRKEVINCIPGKLIMILRVAEEDRNVSLTIWDLVLVCTTVMIALIAAMIVY